MKRNKLVSTPHQSNIFSSTATRLGTRRHLFSLSLFTIVSISITSIVLATSRPAVTSNQSQIIDLPNLSAQVQSETSKQNAAQVSTLKMPAAKPAKEIVQDQRPATTVAPQVNDLALLEQQALDEVVSNTTDSDSATSTNVASLTTPELTWRDVTVKSGDNLSLIFPRVGLTARDVYNVAQLGKEIKPLLNLKPGQTLNFGLTKDKKLQRLELVLSPLETFNVINTEQGYQANSVKRAVDLKQVHTAGTIESSLFEAGLEAGLSNKLVMELAYIFGWDIDFALDLRKNDQFKLIYQEQYLDGEKIANGAILAAEFINQGKTYKAIRFTDDSGMSRYYSPNGDSMRKAFSRTPVHFSRISSRFNPNRKHPKLKGVTRPHRGVDYAAKTGTPILATGDGKVNFVGTKGGYGRTVVLSHGGKYTTLYAHMTRYKKGIKRGKRVKQGDIIGYVGMTGTATGPHLHYEFRVNGVHRNPLTVKLPKAEALAKKYRDAFNQQAQPLLAKLDAVSNTTLALNN